GPGADVARRPRPPNTIGGVTTSDLRVPDVRLVPVPLDLEATDEPPIDCVAIPVRPPTSSEGEVRVGPGAAETVAELGVDLATMLKRLKAKGEPGEVTSVPVAAEHSPIETLLLVGTGAESGRAYLRAGVD